jgi:hypothetical protein
MVVLLVVGQVAVQGGPADNERRPGDGGLRDVVAPVLGGSDEDRQVSVCTPTPSRPALLVSGLLAPVFIMLSSLSESLSKNAGGWAWRRP